MAIIDKNIISLRLHEYYKEHYGELDSDIWFEKPAVNVWVFKREDQIITRKFDIKNGEITTKTE